MKLRVIESGGVHLLIDDMVTTEATPSLSLTLNLFLVTSTPYLEDLDAKERVVEAIDTFLTSDTVRCGLAGLGVRGRPTPNLPWAKGMSSAKSNKNNKTPPSIIGGLVELLIHGRPRAQRLVAITLGNP